MPEPPLGAQTSLTAQFVRHAPRYLLGVLLLGSYQAAQYFFARSRSAPSTIERSASVSA